MNNLFIKTDHELFGDSETEINHLREYCANRAYIISNLHKDRRRKRKDKKRRKSGSFDETAKIDTVLTQEQSEAIEKRFDHLLSSLKKEGFTKEDECMIHVSQAKITAMTHGKWEGASQLLEHALTTTRTFEISKFIDRYNEYKHTSHALRGKNIVLFLGSTGVGKSTTIHYLCGSKMNQNPQTGHISAVNVTNEYLKRIEILDKLGDSVTKYITPVPVNLYDILPELEKQNAQDNKKKNKNKNKAGKPDVNSVDPNPNLVVLCDTPGDEDSGGNEIKLANTLSLLHAMYAANQIAIIFVINRSLISSAGRSIAFKQSAENLKNLLRDYRPNDNIVDKLDDIRLVFTRYDYDEFEENDDIIDFFGRYCEAMYDETGKFLAEYIHERLDVDDIIRINPLQDEERQDVLQKIFEDMKWIKATEDNFKGVNHDYAMKAAIYQAVSYFERINTICKLNQGLKTNFKFIETKLDQIYNLNTLLKDKQIERILKDSIESVSLLWNDTCNNALQSLNGKNNNDTDLYEQAIRYLRQVIDELLTPYQRLQQKYLTQTTTAREMRLNAKLQFHRLVSKLRFGFDGSNPSIPNSLIQHIIKIEVTLRYFVEWNIEFFKQISSLQKELEQCITSNEFKNVALGLNLLTETISSLKYTREFATENEKENDNNGDNKVNEDAHTPANSRSVVAVSADTVEKLSMLLNDTKLKLLQYFRGLSEQISIAMAVEEDDDLYAQKSIQQQIQECEKAYNCLFDAARTIGTLCNGNDLVSLAYEITNMYNNATLILETRLQKLQTEIGEILEDGKRDDSNPSSSNSNVNEEKKNNSMVSDDTQKWRDIREKVENISELLNINETFGENHLNALHGVIDEITQHLKMNTNLNTSEQTFKWIEKYRQNQNVTE